MTNDHEDPEMVNCDCVGAEFASQVRLDNDVVLSTHNTQWGPMSKIAKKRCEHCGGTGRIPANQCPRCGQVFRSAQEAAERFEVLEAELAWLRKERERLFEWAVDCEQMMASDPNRTYHLSKEEAVARVLDAMTTGDEGCPETLAALAEHDAKLAKSLEV